MNGGTTMRATNNLELGLSRLLSPGRVYDGEYIGSVLSADEKGRIKAMIPPLFEGLSESDLPWISMASDVRFLASPKIGDLVGIRFNNSIYEGFYTRVYVTDDRVSGLDISSLGDGFEIDLDEVKIFGRYDGTEVNVVTPEFEAKITPGVTEMKGKGTVKIDSAMMVLNQGTAPMLNQLTPCQFTGAPHVSTMPNVVGG